MNVNVLFLLRWDISAQKSTAWKLYWPLTDTLSLPTKCVQSRNDLLIIRLMENQSATIKGIMSRICWLLFVNTTFKVGPSSPAQSAGAYGTYDLANGRYTPAHHTLRIVTGWRLHTTAQRLVPRNVPSTARYRQRAESLQIQTSPYTSSGS